MSAVPKPGGAAAVAVPRRNEIHESLMSAIVEHRLRPGTKLTEDRLAQIYGVSRTVIHGVLLRLSHERVVTLVHNRGAFVASPTVDDAREVFEARRLIEPRIVERVCERVTRQQLGRIKTMLRAETRAREQDDRRAIVRLSGEFHMLLAEIAGNKLLMQTMHELTALTCLTILLYDAPVATACQYGEHEQLVAAIERGESRRAVQLMLHHLDHIEAALRLEPAAPEDFDLERALVGP